MWRLLVVVVVAIATLGIACSDGLSDEEDFVLRMEHLKEATFTVTYDYTVDEEARKPITWYQMGDFGRTDTVLDLSDRGRGDEDPQFISLQGPMSPYRCSEIAMSSTYNMAGCVLEPTNGGVFLNSPPDWLQIAIARPNMLDVDRLEDRTFAGMEARCFAVEADSGDGADMELCLTSDGVPVHVEIRIPDTVGKPMFTATNVSDDVPADIFEPPMEVVGAGPLCSGPNALGNCGPQDND